MITAIIIVFILGYVVIALEHPLKIDKAAAALITGIVCWVLFAFTFDTGIIPSEMLHEIQHELKLGGEAVNDHSIWREFVSHELGHHLIEIAEILFFLMGAMTIVELIDIHGGFSVITNRITTTNKRKLLWVICLLTFFLSAALDNLTTAIVMVSLLSKLIKDKQDRLFFAGMIVISANSGGAWSPIGDITTTMLWNGKQITTANTVVFLILPSLISLVVPLLILTFTMKGKITSPEVRDSGGVQASSFERNLIFFIGVVGLISVPIFKIVTHLPPYMGMMLSLGMLWLATEVLHKNKKDKFKAQLSASHALEKIDIPSVLFFLGILLAVSTLQSSGTLHSLAHWLTEKVGNDDVIVSSIGLLSSIVDNVPLVKAAQGMYEAPVDAKLWQYLAYCAGTGGSVLIIGSAAGVAVMGIEKIDFFWYLKRIGWLALIGYVAGAAVYLLQYELVGNQL